MSEGVSIMNLLMVIFGLVAILGAIGTYQAFKEKNMLGVGFNLLAFLIFGWFTFMTIKDHGFPPSLH